MKAQDVQEKVIIGDGPVTRYGNYTFLLHEACLGSLFVLGRYIVHSPCWRQHFPTHGVHAWPLAASRGLQG